MERFNLSSKTILLKNIYKYFFCSRLKFQMLDDPPCRCGFRETWVVTQAFLCTTDDQLCHPIKVHLFCLLCHQVNSTQEKPSIFYYLNRFTFFPFKNVFKAIITLILILEFHSETNCSFFLFSLLFVSLRNLCDRWISFKLCKKIDKARNCIGVAVIDVRRCY